MVSMGTQNTSNALRLPFSFIPIKDLSSGFEKKFRCSRFLDIRNINLTIRFALLQLIQSNRFSQRSILTFKFTFAISEGLVIVDFHQLEKLFCSFLNRTVRFDYLRYALSKSVPGRYLNLKPTGFGRFKGFYICRYSHTRQCDGIIRLIRIVQMSNFILYHYVLNHPQLAAAR